VKEIVALPGLRGQLTGILSLQLADSTASIADTSVPDKDNISSVSEADKFDSSSATIRITMTPVPMPSDNETQLSMD